MNKMAHKEEEKEEKFPFRCCGICKIILEMAVKSS